MNALESGRIQKSCGISKYHPPISSYGRNGPPAPVGQRFGAVANHLSAFQQLHHKWMFLKFLQNALRIEPRVGIIEAGHKSEGNDIVSATVNPSPAILFTRQWPTHRI